MSLSMSLSSARWGVKTLLRSRSLCSFRGFELSRMNPLFYSTEGNSSSSSSSHIHSAHLNRLFNLLDRKEGSLLTEEDDVKPYRDDWLGQYGGTGSLVLRPSSTDQISSILRYCNEHKIQIVPQGGNTGLVGGSVPCGDEAVLSLGKLNKVIHFDEHSGVLTCQAGCILEELDQFLEEKGFRVPLDLGAKGTCQIGGNLSTNAGGLRLLRYGSLHGTVLGLKVVLADGSVLDVSNNLRKNNTGYGLHHLFIGAEGTLGVVTELSLLATRRLPSEQVMFLGVPNFESAVEVLGRARIELGEILSAYEFLDRDSLRLVLKHFQETPKPLDSESDIYVLIETQGSNEKHDKEKLMEFLERLMEEGKVVDGTMAQNPDQKKSLWQIRERITLALGKNGYVYKYDFSLPVKRMYEMVEDVKEKVGERGLVVGYGHMGDGNLHLNISVPEKNSDITSLLEPYVYDQTKVMDGSISAEHGIGMMKRKYLSHNKGKEAIQLMNKLKEVLDPNGILNPNKVL